MDNSSSSWSYFCKSGLNEVKLLRKHFQIHGDGERVFFREPITPQKIRGFYSEYQAKIRPPKLKTEKVLPKPENTILRGLYIGQPDANSILNLIVRHSLYIDQILITDPFCDPLKLKGENDILAHPEKWAEEIANRALCLCALENWIEKGIVLIIPNFSYYFPDELAQAIENFTKSGFVVPKEDGIDDKFGFLMKLFVQEAPENRIGLFNVLENMGLKTSEYDRLIFLNRVQEYENKNPIRFRLSKDYFNSKNFPSGKIGQIVNFSNGIALPLAYPIANATGSILLFESFATYEVLSKVVTAKNQQDKAFEELGLAFQKLDFDFLNNVSLEKALELRENGYLQKFRVYLRDLWNISSKNLSNKDLVLSILEFSDRLKSEYFDLKREWEKIRADLRTSAVVNGMAAGLAVATTGLFNITFGTATGLGLSLISGLNHYQSINKEVENIRKNPLAVFINLK